MAVVDLVVRQAEVMSEDLMVGASAEGGWVYSAD